MHNTIDQPTNQSIQCFDPEYRKFSFSIKTHQTTQALTVQTPQLPPTHKTSIYHCMKCYVGSDDARDGSGSKSELLL